MSFFFYTLSLRREREGEGPEQAAALKYAENCAILFGRAMVAAAAAVPFDIRLSSSLFPSIALPLTEFAK